MRAIKRLLFHRGAVPPEEAASHGDRLKQADRRMDEQETRLLMHEWEAYGHPRRRSQDQYEN